MFLERGYSPLQAQRKMQKIRQLTMHICFLLSLTTMLLIYWRSVNILSCSPPEQNWWISKQLQIKIKADNDAMRRFGAFSLGTEFMVMKSGIRMLNGLLKTAQQYQVKVIWQKLTSDKKSVTMDSNMEDIFMVRLNTVLLCTL